MKNKINIRKITLTGIFIAISVIGSLFSFPVLGSKCAPIQHLMNIMGAVFLGPWYTLAAAFITSILRNLLGLGTLMAFPGSMCGALLSGGEVAGTGIIGGLLAYPVAAFVLGNTQAAVFAFVVPFLISTCGGAVLAVIIVGGMKKSGIMERFDF